MNNAYFVAFHQSANSLIKQAGAKNLGLSQDVVDQYSQKIALLNDAVLKTQGSDKTALIATYDAQRDKYFRFVRNVLANLKNSTDPELAALYDTANAKILKLYPAKIANESNQEETSHINGFIIDVEKFLEGKLEKLGIKSALTALKTANDNFQDTFLERSDELSGIEEGATAKLRVDIDELFSKIEISINYGSVALADADDESSVMINAACVNYITVLNQYISEIWQTIKLGKALTKKKDDKTNGSSSNGGCQQGSSTGGNSSSTSGGSSNSGSDLPTLGA